MRVWKRIQMWTRRRQFEADLAEEVRLHRELAGGPAFGSEALFLEQSREAWGVAWLDSLGQDIRYALRGFRKSPGFALGVVGAIGIALGLNTTMFTVFNAYALRPYAVRDAQALYGFTWFEKDGRGNWFTADQYASLLEQRAAFSDVVATRNFGGEVDGRTLFGQAVSGNYFTMLGVGMAQGRPLLPGESGASMVLSYDAWRNKFAADPSLVGRKVYLRGEPFEVVGIANSAFTGIESFPGGFWIPLRAAGKVMEGPDLYGPQHPNVLNLIGRLQPGLQTDGAKQALLAWTHGFAPKAIGIAMTSRATAVPMTRDAIITFIPLFMAFGLVLLIACANVANMMLARALARQREVAIRVSLGAGRARLIRQLLTESLLLAVPAAIAGFLISESTITGAQRLLFATVPPAFGRILSLPDLSPDWRVFFFMLAAAAVTAVLFGLAPAIQTTRSRLVQANRGDFSSDYRPARMRSMLVIAQVAVCGLLLICTGIVVRGERRVVAQPVGLQTHGVWDVRMVSHRQAAAAAQLAQDPAVEAVAVAWHAPLYGTLRAIEVTPSGRRDTVTVGYNFVSPGYFPIFHIPVVRGRSFSDSESEAESPVVVVSEAAARRLWPQGDAIGATINIPVEVRKDPYYDRVPAFTSARVIGVVPDVVSGMVANGSRETCIYFPTNARAPHNDSILVRLGGPAGIARKHLAATLDRVAPSLSDFINPMGDVLALQIYPFQVTFWVAGFLGGVALLLTVSGIYGVMAYLVSQRSKEIGIRIALGAGAGDIVRMVLRQTGRLTLIGMAAGVAMALGIAPLVAHELEVIKPYDLLPYAGVSIVLLVSGLVAAWQPTVRALRIDPASTLRCD